MSDQNAGARIVEKMYQQYGCLPAMPDELIPALDGFTPETLGAALERAVNAAAEYGHPKITLHFDLPDAMKLARFLKGT